MVFNNPLYKPASNEGRVIFPEQKAKAKKTNLLSIDKDAKPTAFVRKSSLVNHDFSIVHSQEAFAKTAVSKVKSKKKVNADLKKIEKLSNQKNSSAFVSKVIKVVRGLWTTQGDIRNQERTNVSLRTQEHLMRDGSNIAQQRDAFVSGISQKKGGNFKLLSKEMKSLEERTINDPFIQTSWGKNQQQKLSLLKEGQSMWIDCKTSHHTMLMRVTKQGDGFTVQYSNTGAGTIEHPEFHKPLQLENGKIYIQSVCEFRNVPKETLNKAFFDKIEVAAGQKAKSDIEERGGEDRSPINAIYEELKVLGTPVEIPFNENSLHWSLPQLGGSCTPSSMWALSKFVLTPAEYKEVTEDVKLKSLKTNYSHIKNGWDRSSTAKIMVLDQVQTLKGLYAERQENAPKVFDTIENELLDDLGMQRAEVKISNKNQIALLLTPVASSANDFTIEPTKNVLNLKKYSLKATVTSEKIDQAVSYNASKDGNSNRLKGKDALDSIYLLYHSDSIGDHQMANHYLEDVLNNFASIDKNYNELNKEIENKGKESGALIMEKIRLKNDESEEGKGRFKEVLVEIETKKNEVAVLRAKKEILDKKINQTATLLASHATQLNLSDQTRSGVAKAFYLANLSVSLSSLTKKKNQEFIDIRFEHIKMSYHNLNVQFYLPKDNIWLMAIDKLVT